MCTIPRSNLKLFSGVCPILPVRDAGVRFAMGTDASSLNNDNDIWPDLRLGWFLARPPSIDSEPLPARDWLRCCIREGNRVALCENGGSLEEGKTADIILMDGSRIYEHPNSHPALDPWMLLLHRAQGSHVHTVLTGGNVVRRGGRSVLVDESDVGRRLSTFLVTRHESTARTGRFSNPSKRKSIATSRCGNGKPTFLRRRSIDTISFERGIRPSSTWA